MYVEQTQFDTGTPLQRRKSERLDLQCRARIRIGDRHYAGYLHNISEGGAKLRTISAIRKHGRVVLTLPDLPPMLCELRWTDSYNAGVKFQIPIDRRALADWAGTRRERADIDLAEPTALRKA